MDIKLNLKLFRKEKVFKKESFWFNINLYWKMVVGFLFITTAFSLFFGYKFFYQINYEESLNSIGLIQEPNQNRKERIEKVLEYFNIRKKVSNEIISLPAAFVDPSL